MKSSLNKYKQGGHKNDHKKSRCKGGVDKNNADQRFITLLLAGATRFSHLLYVGDPESIKSLFGLNRLPLAGTTLTRYFNKIKTMWHSEQVSEGIWNYMKRIFDWAKIKR